MEKPSPADVGALFKDFYYKEFFIRQKYPWPIKEALPFKKPYEMSGLIEIIGLSGSGKTTFVKMAKESLDLGKVIIRPELITYNESGEIENWSHGQFSLKMKGLMAAEYGRVHQQMIWNMVKLISHIEGSVDAKNTGKSLLIERGCNDVLATFGSTFPEHYSYREDWTHKLNFGSVILNSLQLASQVDAVILFGTNWDTTKQRRIKSGQEPEGKYVNSIEWPNLMKGYEIWLGSFYPLFRQSLGMGLLIVDGTRDLDENNQKILKFCNAVFSMKVG